MAGKREDKNHGGGGRRVPKKFGSFCVDQQKGGNCFGKKSACKMSKSTGGRGDHVGLAKGDKFQSKEGTKSSKRKVFGY